MCVRACVFIGSSDDRKRAKIDKDSMSFHPDVIKLEEPWNVTATINICMSYNAMFVHVITLKLITVLHHHFNNIIIFFVTQVEVITSGSINFKLMWEELPGVNILLVSGKFDLCDFTLYMNHSCPLKPGTYQFMIHDVWPTTIPQVRQQYNNTDS